MLVRTWFLVVAMFGVGACSEAPATAPPTAVLPGVEVPSAAEGPAASLATRDDASAESEARSRFGRLPMRFEENRGQHDARARYVARQGGLTLFATDSALVLSLRVPEREAIDGETGGATHAGGADVGGLGVSPPGAGEDRAGVEPAPHLRGLPEDGRGDPVQHVGLSMWLEGGAERAALEAAEPLETRSNYLIGNDPSAWHTDIPNWGALRYRGVRPGVDLVLRGSADGRIEYDLEVAPGAGEELVMRLEGAGRLTVAADGALEVHIAGGVLRQTAPVAYQEVEGRRVAVEAHYRVLGRDRVQFELGEHDPSRPLVIDPVLEYATYLGGSNNDLAYGIAVESAGAAYVTGYTTSTDFPATTGALRTTNAGSDAFVAKLNATGSSLVYATYLGGTGSDEAYGIAVDGAGAAYVTGYTISTDFPATTGALRTTRVGDYDAFVAKLNAAGSALVYATYLGGSDYDEARGIAVDGAGAAYVTGYTISTDFPATTGALRTTNAGSTDAFVAKLNAAGSALAYATYLGGAGYDVAVDIAVDGAGAAYVTGYTISTDFPATTGALRTTRVGDYDAFVAKLNAAGSALTYATYLGGAGYDEARGIAVDGAGAAYVTGYTFSTDFPTTTGALRTTSVGGFDAFVAKLNAAGSALAYATYLGGTNFDSAVGIAVDGAGAAYVTGFTGSTDFPTTTGALQTTNAGDRDAFVAKLNAAGSALVYATYLGGTSVDIAVGIAVDGAGAAYVTGYTNSADFPATTGALRTANAGGVDAFVAKVDFGRPAGAACTGAAQCASGFCTDGVCCNTACGGGATNDCQACSVAAGAAVNGTCASTTGNACTDGNGCTTTDVCSAGTCAGSGSPCLSGTSCTAGTGGSYACSACPAGTFSADGTGAAACTACAPGTWSAAGATSCTAWTTCAPGRFVSTAGTATSDRVCTLCGAGTFSASSNATSCSACLPGSFSATPGAASCTLCEAGSFSATSNATSCSACAPGTFSASSGAASCTLCAAGTFSATSNATSCSACAPGTFSASSGAASCTLCEAGTFTATSNATSCSACAPETWSPAGADRCAAWADCAPGSFVATAGSASSDRTCDACAPGTYAGTANAPACAPWTSCAAAEYETMAPSAIVDRVCTALTVCGADEYESAAATPTSDRTCTPLTVCTAGEYESTAATPTSDRTCTLLTVCGADEFESVPPTPTSDRTCTLLTVCGADEFESVPPTPTSDRECTAAGPCGADEYEVSPPTPTADRVCAPYTECAAGEYQSVAPTGTSDRECTACTECGAGEVEVTACTATEDTVCGPAVDGGSAVDAGVRDAGVRDASPDAADFDAGGGTPATEGCACRAAGSTPARGAGLAWFGLAIVGALVVRRRR